mmetsp:Transcript_32547/g.98131  ORF Transcript_32547/g.98131 Transcript_32547/m.98131 type:complete len:244 (-) Transcript_32547:85-816(-)
MPESPKYLTLPVCQNQFASLLCGQTFALPTQHQTSPGESVSRGPQLHQSPLQQPCLSSTVCSERRTHCHQPAALLWGGETCAQMCAGCGIVRAVHQGALASANQARTRLTMVKIIRTVQREEPSSSGGIALRAGLAAAPFQRATRMWVSRRHVDKASTSQARNTIEGAAGSFWRAVIKIGPLRVGPPEPTLASACSTRSATASMACPRALVPLISASDIGLATYFCVSASGTDDAARRFRTCS